VSPLLDSDSRGNEKQIMNMGDDVLRERQRAFDVTPGEENLIVLRDLKKEFPPQDGNPKKTAVENMSLVIKRGECFGCVNSLMTTLLTIS
jgi:ABC-type glutathione transport system ATPase component